MALHLVGLGLSLGDIPVRGLELVRRAEAVYAEFYTAILGASAQELDAFLGVPVTHLDRLGVEKGGARLVEEAASREVVLLTAGDPLTATTHTDLLVRARSAGVPVHVVHAPSIFTAAPGLLGLQHYKMGRTTTLVRPEPRWFPTSPFDAVAENRERGLHTLVLLDIKADEGYYMRANEGLQLLLQLAGKVGATWFNLETQVGVVARAGSTQPTVRTGPLANLLDEDFGAPLHCLIVPGPLQVVEQEAWDQLAVR